MRIEGGGEAPVVISGRLDATQAAAGQADLDRLGRTRGPEADTGRCQFTSSVVVRGDQLVGEGVQPVVDLLE